MGRDEPRADSRVGAGGDTVLCNVPACTCELVHRTRARPSSESDIFSPALLGSPDLAPVLPTLSPETDHFHNDFCSAQLFPQINQNYFVCFC